MLVAAAFHLFLLFGLTGFVPLFVGVGSASHAHLPIPTVRALPRALVDVQAPQSAVPGTPTDREPQFVVPAAVRVIAQPPILQKPLADVFLEPGPGNVFKFRRLIGISDPFLQMMAQDGRASRLLS